MLPNKCPSFSGGIMAKLFLEYHNEKYPIPDSMVKKYQLDQGMISPFTRGRIVNEYGEFYKIEPPKEVADLSLEEDGVDEMENGLSLSTSEILDIAAGTDSDMTP